MGSGTYPRRVPWAKNWHLPSVALHDGASEMNHQGDCRKRANHREQQTYRDAAHRVSVRDFTQASTREAQE